MQDAAIIDKPSASDRERRMMDGVLVILKRLDRANYNRFWSDCGDLVEAWDDIPRAYRMFVMQFLRDLVAESKAKARGQGHIGDIIREFYRA
jgi:hypothetical protein